MNKNLRFKMSKITIIVLFLSLLSLLVFCLLIGSVQAATSYSPYDIEKSVKDKRWDTKGSNEYSPTSGKQIQYGVYKGTGSSNKKPYKIEQKDFGKGKESFLTFYGWSALVGYTHHNSKNQSTYIVAVNVKEKKEKMYRLQQTSLDASKDIEYNRKSSTGPITNRCPNGTYNKMNNTCNMDYKSVGFKAWIPLNDLFPDENKGGEWELYIVKRVGTGSKMNVVYDQLITPFEFDAKSFQKGTISLSSGENAKQLRMLVSDAVRRSKPRGTDNVGNYFTKNKTYSAKTSSEKYTVNWYGVKSPHDNDSTRYATSLYWRSQGDQAKIRYDVSGKLCPDGTKVQSGTACTVDVTIRHVDVDTGQVLRTDKKKSTVGKEYSYKPVKTGTFVNPAGVPYKANPNGQQFSGKTTNNNMTFTFTYRAKGDPQEENENIKIEIVKQGDAPKASGYFLWELRRTKSNAVSQIYVDSKFNIESNHYAIRNAQLTILGPGISKQNESAISFLTNASALKNKKLSYNFTYEYTNYYKKIYVKEWYWVPGDSYNPGYYDWYWKYDRTEVAWDRGDTFSLNDEVDEDLSSKVDHSQKEMFELDEMKDLNEVKLIVGKRQNWTSNIRTLNKTYYETFSKPSDSDAKTDNHLHSQTYFKMEPDRIKYEVELPSGENKNTNFSPLLKQGSSGKYFPYDIDINLQEHYKASEENTSNSSGNKENGDTIFVTGELSPNYDKDGYKGTLTPYVYNIYTTEYEKKYVTNQPSSNYKDSEGYEGILTPYVASGSFYPIDWQSVSVDRSGTFTCRWISTGNGWSEAGGTNLPSSMYYSSGSYSGILYLTWDTHSPSCYTIAPTYKAPAGQTTTATVSAWGTYSGTIEKAAQDTRVWRYQGTVTKKGKEVEEIRYRGYVTKYDDSPEENEDEGLNLGNYEFPLQMQKFNRIGMNGNSSVYELNFVTDYFFMSKNFGYIGYYPYAERVKENLLSGKSLPSPDEILNTVKQTTSTDFERQTKEKFEDTFMYIDRNDTQGLYGTGEKLQRYWLPIDPKSSLENEVEYDNQILLNDMGLSDASFTFAQRFNFDLYLMGSIHDDVAIWEQVEPRANVDYDYSITISPEQQKEIVNIKRNKYFLHGFRSIDTNRLYRELKNILNTSFGNWW